MHPPQMHSQHSSCPVWWAPDRPDIRSLLPAAPLRLPPVQLAMFDTPMSARQLEYLRKTHAPLIAKHNITQCHFDIMLQYLTDAMRENGAEVCPARQGGAPAVAAACDFAAHQLPAPLLL